MKEINYVINVLEDIINENNVAFNDCKEEELRANFGYSKFYKKLWFSNLRIIDTVKMLKLFSEESKS